jgi:hypothetical protein
MKKKPLGLSWPITRERYRQVLMKMRRQGKNLLANGMTHEIFIEGLELRIENLIKTIEVLERHEKDKASHTLTDYQSELATTLAILQFYKNTRALANDTYNKEFV